LHLSRTQLTVVLNALHDTGTRNVSLSHPSNKIGELIQFNLNDPSQSTVRFTHNRRSYSEAVSEVSLEHPNAASDLPGDDEYANALVAGGLVELGNQSEIEGFLETHGRRDLNAGQRPLVAGFDTNLFPWRMHEVLDLYPNESGRDDQRPLINGYALSGGVFRELEWDNKISDTTELEDAFGKEFDKVWNQPKGSRRQGRLGEVQYRKLRDHQYADEIDSDRGDEEIVGGYREYQNQSRKDVLFLSNDRNVVERARGGTMLSHHIEFPSEIPRKTEASWWGIQDTIFMLSVVFGVVKLPKVTIYGVWKGKEGQDWHNENVELDCRSPKVQEMVERDRRIIDAFN